MALTDRPLPVRNCTAPPRRRHARGPLRAMSGGEPTCCNCSSVSRQRAYEVAERLEQRARRRVRRPGPWKQPTLAPNDTCYPSNTNAACFNATYSMYMSEWHLMPSGSEAGGANLPPAWDITTGSSSMLRRRARHGLPAPTTRISPDARSAATTSSTISRWPTTASRCRAASACRATIPRCTIPSPRRA